jgi:protein TonB
MIRRVLASGCLAAFITLGLFFLMQSLIESSQERPLEEVKGQVIDFVRVKHETEAETKKRRLPTKVKPEEQPPPPPISAAKSQRPETGNLSVGAPVLGPELALAGPDLTSAPADTSPIPLVRIDPMYPMRALSRGIEGWVLVEFTITSAGTVENPVVVDADPPSVFNREATKAIRRWKYKPKIVNGRPVAQPGVRTLITFEIGN